MTHPACSLRVMAGRYAICRLESAARVPDWATGRRLLSITRTPAELSVVCPEEQVPAEVSCDRGWRVLEVQGPFDLATTGVVASIAGPLAAGGISLFVVSTYATDYVLVKDAALGEAISALAAGGHRVFPEGAERGLPATGPSTV
jgi:hypothetical protein